MRSPDMPAETDEEQDRPEETLVSPGAHPATVQESAEEPTLETHASGEPAPAANETDSPENIKQNAGASTEDDGPATAGRAESPIPDPGEAGIPDVQNAPAPMQPALSSEPAAAPPDDATEPPSTLPQALELAAVAATLTSLEERLGESQRLLLLRPSK